MVADGLRKNGYLVASMRHVGGPGDLLACAPLDTARMYRPRPLLIEVKGTKDFPWLDYKGFGRPRRQEMIDAGVEWNVEPILAWWPPHLRGGPIWLPASDWPGDA